MVVELKGRNAPTTFSFSYFFVFYLYIWIFFNILLYIYKVEFYKNNLRIYNNIFLNNFFHRNLILSNKEYKCRFIKIFIMYLFLCQILHMLINMY